MRIVEQPPFEITEEGWGEFPIRIDIHFHEIPPNIDFFKNIDPLHSDQRTEFEKICEINDNYNVNDNNHSLNENHSDEISLMFDKNETNNESKQTNKTQTHRCQNNKTMKPELQINAIMQNKDKVN